MRIQNILTVGLLTAAFATSARAASADPYTGSRIFWDTSSRTTVINGGTYGRMIQLQDGRLMAACESGGIKIAFSSNLGKTWDSATKIVNNPSGINESVPDLIQLADGTLIVAYNPRPTSPYSTDRKFGIRCKRSTDNGRTWSDEIFVNDASHVYEDGCWEPSMLQLPSGEVQLYFADEGPFTSSGEQQISMCRSFDGGLSWSTAQRVSFRPGNRDGMPVPVLLKDESEIVFIFEDSGWGYGDFFPTTARTTLANNWNNYWVGANDKNREQTLNLDFCPRATGGAPYLRVLPWGETVMSYQSTYEHDGKLQMRVAVGNAQARDFKAMSVPFSIGATEQGLWNSVAVIDTGVVVAVSAISGNIEMIKGYPVRLIQAPFGRPTLDGKQTRNEGYYNSTAQQIILGSQTGTRVTADFAYDMDSLYFFARVADRTQVPNGANSDGVTLLLNLGETTTSPQTGCYRLFLRMDGGYLPYYGTSGGWRRTTAAQLPLRIVPGVTTSAYIIEAAIPWSSLGLEAAPIGQRLAVAVECTDNRSGTVYTETIPDANNLRPWTWMEFRLGEVPVGIGAPQAATPSGGTRVTELPAYLAGAPLRIIRETMASGQTVTRKQLVRRR